jgi:hypothetical protein
VLGTDTALYIIAVVTSLAMPDVSYLFVWPLLIRSAAKGLVFVSPKQGTGLFSFLLELFSALIAVVLFVPGILIALLSIDMQMIFLVPVFVVSFLGFLYPIWSGSGHA